MSSGDMKGEVVANVPVLDGTLNVIMQWRTTDNAGHLAIVPAPGSDERAQKAADFIGERLLNDISAPDRQLWKDAEPQFPYLFEAQIPGSVIEGGHDIAAARKFGQTLSGLIATAEERFLDMEQTNINSTVANFLLDQGIDQGEAGRLAQELTKEFDISSKRGRTV